MFKQLMLTAGASAAYVTSTAAMAHPGHDHSAESANLIHILWAAPIVIVAVMVVKLLKAKQAKTQLAKTQLDNSKANEAHSTFNQH
ncbi:hypothetical protein MSG37_02340 [Shewanella sp. 1CM18E]|uniref:hypothetical protein n=1 Tax=Shewanella sp. 1CM18E TaxID=2929169 RepID=UPI0020BD837D|nr:hypothetical protein [Shewanella sp. 1CM18E]MCK8043710.1 hypothetical protein [Shewanella sp. 1CM18E]